MSSAYPQPSASARKLMQLILRRLATVKNQTVAEAIGKDESTVSRIAAGESGIKLIDLQPFLVPLGLKIVPAENICINVEKYNAMLVLAQAAMAAEKKIEGPQLDWEEPR